MRALIQRVSQATVSINEEITAQIGHGLLVLIGIAADDTTEDINYLTKKIIKMRIFEDENMQMNRDIEEVNGELLIVSQFTLLASTKKGNRPSFIHAAKPQSAIPLYNIFIQEIKNRLPGKVQTGIFGADMQINLTNSGPVTIWIDSKNKE